MKQRLLVAFLGLPALIAVLLACPAWATMLLVCAISGVAAYELLHTACKAVPKEIYAVTIAISAAIVAARYLEKTGRQGILLGESEIAVSAVMAWLLVIVLFYEAMHRYGREQPFAFADLAIAVVGGIVFPTFYSCIALLREQDYGKVYVLAPFFIAFAGDALSMGFGSWFGKRKMAPHVSPKKTWAGFVGGPIGSALGMCLLGLIGTKCFCYASSYLALIAVGMVANLFGQLGDLSMSLIKREAGIKDYSHLFLTHGGMLDRFDSTMFIVPIVYFFVSAGII